MLAATVCVPYILCFLITHYCRNFVFFFDFKVAIPFFFNFIFSNHNITGIKTQLMQDCFMRKYKTQFLACIQRFLLCSLSIIHFVLLGKLTKKQKIAACLLLRGVLYSFFYKNIKICLRADENF